MKGCAALSLKQMHCYYDPISKAIWRLWKELSPLCEVLSSVVASRSKVLRGCGSVSPGQDANQCGLRAQRCATCVFRRSQIGFGADSKSFGSPQDGNRKTLSTIAGGPTRAAVTVCAPSPAKSKRPRKSKSSDPDPRLRELVKASSKVTLFPRQYIQYIPGLLTMSTAAPFVCKCQRNE